MFRICVQVRSVLAESLRRDDRGASAVEYRLLVALIAVVIVGAAALGTNLSQTFNRILSRMAV